MDRGAVERRAGKPGHQPRCRLLRLRRRLAGRRAARVRPPRPLSHHHGGRYLRDTPGGRPGGRGPAVAAGGWCRRCPGAHRPAHRAEVAGLPNAPGRSLAHPGRHALADLPDGSQQPAGRRRRIQRRANDLMVVGGSFLAGLRQSRRADAALRRRRPHPAAQRGARHLSPVRAGAPPALARGTDPGPRRRHQPRQRALGALLRESARGEDRRERPAALAAARHRAADPRHRIQYRARSRSVRLVDRRRPCPHRRHPDWPRRKRWGPQHADAGSHGGCRGAGGAGFRCDRQGQGGPARGRVAGRAPWQGPALMAGLPGRAPADGPVVVRRFRRRLRHAGAHPLRLRRRRGLGDLRVHPGQLLPARGPARHSALDPAGGAGMVPDQPAADPGHDEAPQRRPR